MNAWELHPMLVHFPIAFLLAGVALQLWVYWRSRWTGTDAATRLLLAGTILGWLAAGAGVLAFFTVPAHTEEGHYLMYWHLGLGMMALAMFTWLSVVCWRHRTEPVRKPHLAAGLCGALLLTITGYLGGSIVYHHGAGIDPDLLTPEIRTGHTHDGEHSHGRTANDRHPSGSHQEHQH